MAYPFFSAETGGLMRVKALSEAEYHACFIPPMHNVTEVAEAVVDIWPYVDSLLDSDLEDLHPHDVEFVYRDEESKYDHVLLGTCEDNTYLVIIIDMGLRAITGHHLLNLSRLYGLTDEKS